MKPFLKKFSQKDLGFDIIIGITILLIGFCSAYSQISHYRKSGGTQIDFFQMYFEPAVSLACGQGFAVQKNPISFSKPLEPYFKPVVQKTPLYEFLHLKRERLDCAELEKDSFVKKNPPQRIWFYLISAVGLLWKVTGISWQAVDYLTAGFFAISMTLSYCIFRLGMGRFIAIPLTLLLCGSTLQLTYLPWLRDYAKGPFLLATFLILGLLVKHKMKPHYFLFAAALCGLIAGVGYGFRTDILIVLPPVILTILFLTPGKTWEHLPTKISAVITVFAVFYSVAYPVLSSSLNSGSCIFDNPILGLTPIFSSALNLAVSPFYEIVYQYNDLLTYAMVGTQADRYLHLDLDQSINATTYTYCSHAYDSASSSIFKSIIALTPADLLMRGYASGKQILNLGFQAWNGVIQSPWQTVVLIPADNFLTLFYQYSRPLLGIFQQGGIYLSIFATFLIGILNLRFAIFIFLGILYFTFYPGIQFIPRHFYHLEFISLWILGFLIYHTLDIKQFRKALLNGAIRSGIVIGGLCVLGTLIFLIARYFQERNIEKLVATYESAEKKILAKSTVEITQGTDLIYVNPWRPHEKIKQYATGKMLLIEFGGQYCVGKEVKFTLEYHFDDRLPAPFNISKEDVAPVFSNGQKTLVYTPVFHSQYFNFKGIRVPSNQKACVGNIYQVTSLDDYPLWIFLKLPPNWGQFPAYQRLQTP